MGYVCLAIGAEGGDTGTGRGGVFDIGKGGKLATSCVSCCSCAVKAANVVFITNGHLLGL